MIRRLFGSLLIRLAFPAAFFAFSLPLEAAPSPQSLPAKFDTQWAEAQDHQAKGHWYEACNIYDKLRKLNLGCEEINQAYLDCLARINQGRRLRDEAFRKRVLKLKPAAAVKLYEEVIAQLRMNYLAPDRVDVQSLFVRGLNELRFALEDERFRKEFLEEIPTEVIQRFARKLSDWPVDKELLGTEKEASKWAQEVARDAAVDLGMAPSAVLVEFTFGAANALDEFTYGLTFRQLGSLQTVLKGKSVDLGVRLAMNPDQKLEVARIISDNPELGQLKKGDRIVKIDGISTEGFTSADLGELLLVGEEGSLVDLEILTPGEAKTHRLLLPRTTSLHSVKEARMLGDDVGYVKIAVFQESTLQELKSAIVGLQSLGCRALVVDLRGNPGGLFDAGLQTSELFLNDHVIVYTQGRFKIETHKARNPSPFNLPILVVVDAETASTAEIVAGALKENGKAKVAGHTTFGKGTIQCLIPLEKFPAGLRITVAKFLSPANYPYSGHGVIPDYPLDSADLDDARMVQIQALARNLAGSSAPLLPGMKMN